MNRRQLIMAGAATSAIGLTACAPTSKPLEILNVSYDPTRELYESIGTAFSKKWSESNNQSIKIRQSHGGSGKQARSVIDGLEADIVTLALAADIDAIAEKANLLPLDWQSRLPNNSCPYTSTIVFLVRKGNPKSIKEWKDLVRKDIQIITPNPKTSGGARWNYLAAFGWALKTYDGNTTKAKTYIKELFANVPVLDSGARAATTTFVQRGIGDVLLSWENEAILAVEKLSPNQFDIVVPSLSILAEPPVALIDKVADAKGTTAIAKEYLNFLYTIEGQTIIAQNYYRPRNEDILSKFTSRFAKVETLTIDDFGGWKNAQKTHFDDGGIFDEIIRK